MIPCTFTMSTLGTDGAAPAPAARRGTTSSDAAKREASRRRFTGSIVGAAPLQWPAMTAPSASWEDLFARPLLFVSGKGGTGKSTVAAALAGAAASTGRRVLLAEVEGRGEIPRVLPVADPGFTEVTAPGGFSVLSITPGE